MFVRVNFTVFRQFIVLDTYIKHCFVIHQNHMTPTTMLEDCKRITKKKNNVIYCNCCFEISFQYQ